MNIEVYDHFASPSSLDFEVVERKGRGHPDTLSDRLAELLSVTYSKLSREKFGTILRHQFDKLTLMGGKCDVIFGGGGFRSPVRLLINGRATPHVGADKIIYRDLLIQTAADFLESELQNFDFLSDCRLLLEISSHTTRGVLLEQVGSTASAYSSSSAYSRFRPGKLTDLPEYTRPLSNDTAVGCGWAPYTPLEALVLQVEERLNSSDTKQVYPWLGSDIKAMAIRNRNCAELTICVPQVSTLVHSAAEYHRNFEIIEGLISSIAAPYREHFALNVRLTPGDRSRRDLIYMLYTGSCIESGDEGQVGRGNRIGGVISSRRPFSMEGLNGKNPQYHGGKLYSVMAWEFAKQLWMQHKIPSEVFMATQTDRPLDDPWRVVVNSTKDLDRRTVSELAERIFSDVGRFTDRILEGQYPLV